MSGGNIEITKEELTFIRSLEDFDLTMFLSEVHQFGWEGKGPGATGGRKLLPLIAAALKTRSGHPPTKDTKFYNNLAEWRKAQS